MPKSEEVVTREIPIRGISRQVSVSRKIARQEAFRLLNVQFDEEGDSGDDCSNVDSPINFASKIADSSCMDWELEVLDFPQESNGANAGTLNNARSFIKRFDSLGGWSIASRITSEVPIKEIVINGDYEERNFAPSMESRRKKDTDVISNNTTTATSALNIDPQLDQLLRQIQRAEKNARPVLQATKQDELRKEFRGSNHLQSLRGSFVKMYDAIRTGLNDEIVTDSASSSSLSVSDDSSGTHEDDDINFSVSRHGLAGTAETDSASTPKAVFVFPPELKVPDDDSSSEGSLNSFLIGGGCNDSVEVKMEKSKSKKADGDGKFIKFLRESTVTERTAASSVVSEFLSLRSSTVSNFSATSFSDDLVDKSKSNLGVNNNDEGDLRFTFSRMMLGHRSGKRRGSSESEASA